MDAPSSAPSRVWSSWPKPATGIPRTRPLVKKWFQDYLHWLTTSDNANNEKRTGNNHASWWTAQVAAIATFVEDDAQEKAAFNYYRDHIFPRQIKSDGSAPREEARTRSLWYSAFNLEALTTTCRIAQIQGVDLWTVRGKGGATIATVDRLPSALPLRPQEVDQGPDHRVSPTTACTSWPTPASD